MPPEARSAAAVFFVNGLTLTTYLVRIPALKQELHLNNGNLGLIGVLFAMAAIVAMQLVGRASRRFGASAVLKVLLPVLSVTLAGVGLAGSLLTYCVAAILLGAAHGAMDTTMNAYALSVQQRLGQSVMNRCHAAWSISAVAASLLAAALSPLNLESHVLLPTAAVPLLLLSLLLGMDNPSGNIRPTVGGRPTIGADLTKGIPLCP